MMPVISVFGMSCRKYAMNLVVCTACYILRPVPYIRIIRQFMTRQFQVASRLPSIWPVHGYIPRLRSFDFHASSRECVTMHGI